MGVTRALDCGSLKLEKLFEIVNGQDITMLTAPWEDTKKE